MLWCSDRPLLYFSGKEFTVLIVETRLRVYLDWVDVELAGRLEHEAPAEDIVRIE